MKTISKFLGADSLIIDFLVFYLFCKYIKKENINIGGLLNFTHIRIFSYKICLIFIMGLEFRFDSRMGDVFV